MTIVVGTRQWVRICHDETVNFFDVFGIAVDFGIISTQCIRGALHRDYE